MPSPAVTRPPLPVLDIVKASYQAGFSRTAWHMPLLWIPIVLTLLLSWIQYMIPGIAAAGTISSDAPPVLKDMHGPELRHYLELALLTLMQLLFLTSLQVSWLRCMIRGEKPSGAYLGRAMWRYLGYSLCFVLLAVTIFTLVSFPIFVKAAHDNAGILPPAALPVIAIMIVGIVWVATRIVLKFIAVATDDTAMSFSASWQLMQGNVLRWIGGTILSLAPFIALSGIADQIQKLVLGDTLPGMLLWDGLVEGVINVAQVLVCASFAGMAYRHLAPGNGAAVRLIA